MHRSSFSYLGNLCFLVLLAYFCGCSFLYERANVRYRVSTALLSIPDESRHALEAFFSRFVLDTSAAYTLFGPKPMSIESYVDDPKHFSPYDLLHPMNSLVFSRGWQSWELYGHLFPSKKFMLRRIPLDLQTGAYWYIVVINKPAVLGAIQRYYDLFAPVLPGCLGPEEFCRRMETSDVFLAQVLDDAERLGILLGYGRLNAHSFERRAEICIHLNQSGIPPMASSAAMEQLSPRSRFFVDCYRGHCSKDPALLSILPPPAGYQSLAEELNAICRNFERFDLVQDDSLEQFMPPVFMAFRNHPETEELRQAYAKARFDLPRVLSHKPILETVLTKWVSDDP